MDIKEEEEELVAERYATLVDIIYIAGAMADAGITVEIAEIRDLAIKMKQILRIKWAVALRIVPLEM